MSSFVGVAGEPRSDSVNEQARSACNQQFRFTIIRPGLLCRIDRFRRLSQLQVEMSTDNPSTRSRWPHPGE